MTPKYANSTHDGTKLVYTTSVTVPATTRGWGWIIVHYNFSCFHRDEAFDLNEVSSNRGQDQSNPRIFEGIRARKFTPNVNVKEYI